MSQALIIAAMEGNRAVSAAEPLACAFPLTITAKTTIKTV
ncbi:hypothetical protein QO005_003708 [Rhizobium paknamense]|uniref:Uncharacterized protein n=1 Tax=Rhizobium paknamense TaxID=1206817 RepID=A0ABU0IGF3_9HYPH|nr:hypothetical protein [Rhizobium paknamense]